MKTFYRRNFLKLLAISFAFLLISSFFILRNPVSANINLQTLDPTEITFSADIDTKIENARIKELLESPALADFDAWVKQYQSGYLRGDINQINRGETLADIRREVFKELIRLAPEKALDYTISEDAKNDLPASIAAKIERRFSAYGDFIVFAVDKMDSSTGSLRGLSTEREVVFGDARYQAFVYGRRLGMTTKLHIPLQGIILDDVATVDESPLRKLDSSEYERNNVDLQKIGEQGVVAEIGGKLNYFSDQERLDIYTNEQIEWEGKIGSTRISGTQTDEATASSYTEGVKTILIIRVDFSDRPGEPVDVSGVPITSTRVLNLINNDVSPFFVTNSYNKTSLQPTVTPVVRLPQTQSFYGQGGGLGNYTQLLTDARNAARAAGFETNNFNLDAVVYANIQSMDFAGLGYIGAKGLWLNGYFGKGVFAHELGHNYGLSHGNLWRTTDGTVIGQGANQEYGDAFDTMGSAPGDGVGHFNARYKRLLDWLTDANVRSVTSNGIYRIYAQDNTTVGGIRALKINKSSTKNYWIEFRQQFTTNTAAMNGAIIRWDYASDNYRTTQLLDMTPNTSTNVADAPLVIGQSFIDNENHIKITPLGKGNTTPESLDVQVELNVGCTFSLSQSGQSFTSTGGEGSFTVNSQSGCRPYFTSNQNWINVVSTDESSGTYTVRYIISANYGAQHTGIVDISGQAFTITQSAPLTACAANPSGLAAWWRGEVNALDETGANNGTVLSGMSFSAAKIGGGFRGVSSSYSFSNRVIVPDSPSLALDHSLSIEGWVRLDATGNYAILVRSDDRDFAGAYAIFAFSGRLIFQIKSAPGGSNPTVASPGTLPTGQFVHFAATLDDATGQMKLYLNGSLVSQITTTVRPFRDLLPNSNPGLAIGNLNGNLAYDSFNGVIDELSIYNRSLTASEVQAIYNAGIAETGGAGKCLLTTRQAPFDFDGDRKTDIGIFRPATGQWWINRSSSNQSFVSQFGNNTDRLVPADYTGDGKADIAFFRPDTGQWFILRSEDNSFYAFPFGSNGDIPAPGDFDGDGKADQAVFRPSNVTWYIKRSGDNGITIQPFGTAEDQPVVADYDGDGKADIAIFRPSAGQWWILRSSAGLVALQFGQTGDKTVPGDYTGDGKADIAFWRPSNGSWNILRSEDFSFYAFPFGLATDIPTPGDYDGDGKSDAAIYRPSQTTFYLQMSTNGFQAIGYGTTGDQPIPNAFVR